MGMTIEEAIKYYENKNVVLTEKEALANTLALNTMRKYQKIEKIIKNAGIFAFDVPEIRRIAEVIKDGKEKIQV